MQEQEMLELIRQRDPKGAEELLRHYGPLMRYIICAILPNRQDQEDCLSETAMRVWEKIETYDSSRGSLTAWLTALTRNGALNYSRNNSHTAPMENQQDILENVPSDKPTPEEEMLRQEQKEAVKRAVGRLSAGEQVLFYRKYYYLQSTAQIASELGTTERSIEGRLYRLKKKLRKLLGGDMYE